MRIRCLLAGPVFAVLAMVLPCMAEVNEVDSNFDGKIDQWQYVNAQGKIEKIEYFSVHVVFLFMHTFVFELFSIMLKSSPLIYNCNSMYTVHSIFE